MLTWRDYTRRRISPSEADRQRADKRQAEQERARDADREHHQHPAGNAQGERDHSASATSSATTPIG
jgi:hypothetical protein